MAENITATSLIDTVQILLWAFWILCTFAAAVTAIDAPVPDVFKAAVRLSAARGKTWDSKPSALGWLKDVSVPHVWFWHFYLVGVLANVAVLAFLVASALSQPPQASGTAESSRDVSSAVAVMVVLLTHLVRRLTETIFIMRYPPGARMHVLAYIYGLAYYAVLSLSLLPPHLLRDGIMSLVRGPTQLDADGLPPLDGSTMHAASAAPERCAAVAGACGAAEGIPARLQHTPAEMARGVFSAVAGDWLMLTGCVIVLLGQILQSHSHLLLASLHLGELTHAPHAPADTTAETPVAPTMRRRNPDQPSAPQGRPPAAQPPAPTAHAGHAADSAARQYAVPRGGAFEWVSCPHYLGEIVIYGGFCVALRGALLSALVLAWVVVNLVVGAAETQRWYRSTFPAYPPRRRALLPLLW